jgi:uncharacterized protein YoxC
MSFTCPVESNIAPNQLNTTFTGAGDGKNILPSSILPTDRDSDGKLKDSFLNDWIGRLQTANVIPSIRSISASMYVQKVTELLTNSKNEYCFYDARYRSSLEYLFTGIRNTVNNTTEESKQLVEARLEICKTLNRKVNDINQIMMAMTKKMMASSDTLRREIEEFNRNLRLKRDKLEEQNRVIQSNEATMRLQKAMVSYTEEKGRYSDNLLKMYSFLNIVALGLLIYVYKAAGDQ